MLPGMDPRAVKAAMKKMGVKQEEIAAEEVIIRTADKDIIVHSPSVVKINMMGQDSFQISGEVEEVARETELSEEDITAVKEQAGVTDDEAKSALQKHNGDLAAAILSFKN